MKCPHCKKEIVYKSSRKNYEKIIFILKDYDGEILTTEKIRNLLIDFYSPHTDVDDTTLVHRGILEKRGWGLYLVKIPSKINKNNFKRYGKVLKSYGSEEGRSYIGGRTTKITDFVKDINKSEIMEAIQLHTCSINFLNNYLGREKDKIESIILIKKK